MTYSILNHNSLFPYRITNPDVHLLGNTASRSNMYRERLLLTQQRLLRSELFTLRGLSSKSKNGHASHSHNTQEELSTIESLLGSTGSKVLFGMLIQVRLINC